MDDAEVKALLDDTTPGPWRLRKAYLDDDALEIVPRKVRGKASPEVGSWAELATVQIEYTDSTPKANARLIAAAPDLARARALLEARAENDRLRADAQAANGVWQANLRLQAELAAAQQREAELRDAATLAVSDIEAAFKPHTSMVELIRLVTGACIRLRAALSHNGRGE